MDKKLKVAFLIDQGPLPNLFSELLRLGDTADNYTVEALIIQNNPLRQTKTFEIVIDYLRRKGVRKLFARVLFSIVQKIEYWILILLKFDLKILESKEIDFSKHLILNTNPKISDNGLVYRFNENDLDKIRDLNLDIIVRAGSGILRGEILSVSKHGIYSFHHGDNNMYRGSPAGFWEVYNSEPTTGFIIQRLTDELDGGDVLFRGAIRTRPLFLLNQSEIFKKSIQFFHGLIECTSNNKLDARVEPRLPYSSPLYTNPNFSELIKYFLLMLVFLGTSLLRRIFGKAQMWSVAYLRCKSWRDASLYKSTVIKNPYGRFLADPFPCSVDGQDVIFVEDFDFKKNRGQISVVDITDDKPNFLGSAISEDTHMSFPFVFKHNGSVYMIPETHQLKQIRLYKCINFPLEWKLHSILMNGVAAADTMIFDRCGKWFMLTNIDSATMGEHQSELHVFSADAFDSNAWVANKNNPVIFDAKNARNGGILSEDGEVYRVFQTHSISTYGKDYGIAQIVKIDDETYEEKVIIHNSKCFVNDSISTHTLNFSEKILVTDFALNKSRKN